MEKKGVLFKILAIAGTMLVGDCFLTSTLGFSVILFYLCKPLKPKGVVCKRMDAPRITPSMRIALQDLQLDSLLVIYPGLHPYSLDEKTRAIALVSLADSSASPFDK